MAALVAMFATVLIVMSAWVAWIVAITMAIVLGLTGAAMTFYAWRRPQVLKPTAAARTAPSSIAPSGTACETSAASGI
jgi:hypothetical protein